MRILITTGIFEPESGGPATYTPQLAAKLVAAGHEVTVITYSDTDQLDTDANYPFKLVRVARNNKVLNRIKFFFAVFKHARACDMIYTLDWFAAGLPVALACKILRKPYIVRVGGDYLWEQRYLESGQKPVTLKGFYEQGTYAQYVPGVAFRIIRAVLRTASHVVFNSDIQRKLYVRYYGLDAGRVSTIHNPYSHQDSAGIVRDIPTKEIVYWGRLIVMKNVDSLIRAFAQAGLPADYTLIIIGDGPQKESLRRLIGELQIESRVHLFPSAPKHDVLERVKNVRACILPSWTDIAPNQVYEALALGVPTVVTKENYLPIHDQLPEMLDPHSIEDMVSKFKMLADDARYGVFATQWKAISYHRDWSVVVAEHMALFTAVTGVHTSSEVSSLHILQIGADRSPRGILYPNSPAIQRQKAYGKLFAALDIIGFSLAGDGRVPFEASPHVHVYPTRSYSRLFYGLDIMRIARRLPKFDVISVQDPFETGLLGLLMSRMMRVPLHVQVHTDFRSPEYANHSSLNHVRVLIAGFVLRRATRIRVVSERIKHSIEQIGVMKPITVLPIFTDVSRFQNAHPDSKLQVRFAASSHKILVVARLEPEKNVALAISAFAQAATSAFAQATKGMPDACLIIVGEGSERERLVNMVENLHIADRVFFEGEQDPVPYYALADLVLVPSHYEGYGLVILEALAAGKPVLSTDVGIAREAGVIIAEPKDFAQALGSWLHVSVDYPRPMDISRYVYKNLEDYAQKYCTDIAASLQEIGRILVQ